ncbi:hypothetical protein CRYUN_Cryun09bG0117100 [Craigia yunnanensis]
MVEELKNGNIDSIFHIGDISSATGLPVEWEFFLHLISPLASKFTSHLSGIMKDQGLVTRLLTLAENVEFLMRPISKCQPQQRISHECRHRPMYSSYVGLGSTDVNSVDLVLFGHVHNYERTCSIYNPQCLAMPTKDENGIDTYDNSYYKAPVQAIAAGWSLSRICEFVYVKAHATKDELMFVNSKTSTVMDSFRITKKQNILKSDNMN